MIWVYINWWLVLALFVPFWLLQNIIHEISHGLVVFSRGWGFQIYPVFHWAHRDNGRARYFWNPPPRQQRKVGEWQWYFARVVYKQDEGAKDITPKGWLLVALAPRITNTMLMVAMFVDHQMTRPDSSLQTIYALCGACQLVDGLAGILSIFCWWEDRKHTDIWHIYERSGLSRRTIQILAAGWFLLMAVIFCAPLY